WVRPTAFALATVLAGATARDALLAFAWGWAENMAQTAMKAVPLGQAAAQRALTRLMQAIPAAVEAALTMPDDSRQAHAPMLAILSAQHETQYSRLFRS
ncbi:MAG TPA: urease accessory UreF family protein, partial [Rubrivivax sp.]|nr:urease accessory UreF family protein [Rubrivivax sp.]